VKKIYGNLLVLPLWTQDYVSLVCFNALKANLSVIQSYFAWLHISVPEIKKKFFLPGN
jgi:hypothetical protein